MQRRRFLATVAAVGAVAGCIDDGEPDGPTTGNGGETATDTLTPTPRDADGVENGTAAPDDGADGLVVESMTLQHGLVVPETPDSIVVGAQDHRYLWVRVTTTESAPNLTDLSLSIRSGTVDPLDADDRRIYRTGWAGEEYYDGTPGTRLVLFELPLTVDTPRMTFQSPAGQVRATDAETTRLGRSPPSMSASLQKRYDETPEKPIVVQVTNEGDVDGRFLGAINREGPSVAYTPITRVSVPVEAGETQSVPITDSVTHRTATPGNSEPDMTYHLRTLHGDDVAQFGGG